MILSYQTIKRLCSGFPEDHMITPCHERTVLNGKTYGLSSCGYDIRCAERIVLNPGHFSLASSVEQFNMPNYIVAFVNDKSSWARRGLAVQNTVIEPGWRGFLTIELSNHGHEILEIKEGDPIAQIIFHRLDDITEKPYEGKYQDQPAGPQEAIHQD